MNGIDGAAKMISCVKHLSSNPQNPNKARHRNLNLQSHVLLLLWCPASLGYAAANNKEILSQKKLSSKLSLDLYKYTVACLHFLMEVIHT